MNLSGHRNIQSINNYSHVSEQQKKTMSRILRGFASSTEPAVLESTSQNKRVFAQAEYFNINSQHVSQNSIDNKTAFVQVRRTKIVLL